MHSRRQDCTLDVPQAVFEYASVRARRKPCSKQATALTTNDNVAAPQWLPPVVTCTEITPSARGAPTRPTPSQRDSVTTALPRVVHAPFSRTVDSVTTGVARRHTVPSSVAAVARLDSGVARCTGNLVLPSLPAASAIPEQPLQPTVATIAVPASVALLPSCYTLSQLGTDLEDAPNPAHCARSQRKVSRAPTGSHVVVRTLSPVSTVAECGFEQYLQALLSPPFSPVKRWTQASPRAQGALCQKERDHLRTASIPDTPADRMCVKTTHDRQHQVRANICPASNAFILRDSLADSFRNCAPTTSEDSVVDIAPNVASPSGTDNNDSVERMNRLAIPTNPFVTWFGKKYYEAKEAGGGQRSEHETSHKRADPHPPAQAVALIPEKPEQAHCCHVLSTRESSRSTARGAAVFKGGGTLSFVYRMDMANRGAQWASELSTSNATSSSCSQLQRPMQLLPPRSTHAACSKQHLATTAQPLLRTPEKVVAPAFSSVEVEPPLKVAVLQSRRAFPNYVPRVAPPMPQPNSYGPIRSFRKDDATTESWTQGCGLLEAEWVESPRDL